MRKLLSRSVDSARTTTWQTLLFIDVQLVHKHTLRIVRTRPVASFTSPFATVYTQVFSVIRRRSVQLIPILHTPYINNNYLERI